MSEDEWEEFIFEWADSIRPTYTDVYRCGGKGDMGRDIIAFKAPISPKAPWDNYQCKHYGKALSIADAVQELGKLLYYASQGHFTLPDNYYFIAPRGPGTELLKCLQNGTLKQELLNRWNNECRTKIAAKKTIELATVKATIDATIAPAQVIILENVEPPDDLKPSIAFEGFTKNPSAGRYGLFPPPRP